MTTKFFAEALFEHGVGDLLSVIPPGAQLTPTSTIDQSQIGKVPGRKLANGLWAGYDWRKHVPTIDDVRQWSIDGANIGLRADHFPAVDIDCLDEALTTIIVGLATARLGLTAQRVGRAPKTLLIYRTAEPFSRQRLWITYHGQQHLVEILGQGQQYVIAGTHPGTMRPYAWDRAIDALPIDGVPSITRAQASAFLDELEADLEMIGATKLEREGDGRPLTRTAGDQTGLLAPSMEQLRAAVEAIPNTSALFSARADYLKVGYAIRAAAGEANEADAFGIFAGWAAKWEGNDRSPGNDPDVVRADWRRFRAPYSVGWLWLAEQARGFGFHTAADEFDAIAQAPSHDAPVRAPHLSDQWLADAVLAARGGELRYVPQSGKDLVWQGGRWQPDADLLAEDIVKRELRVVADRLMRQGATPKEKAAMEKAAVQVCSAGKAAAVRTLLKSERSIAVSMDALDHDVWALNTPMGIIDLKTGALKPADPDELCTKSTAVPADFGGACPEWRRFLAEATGGDRALEAYLQRLAGYALTGSTREQHLTFIYGPGGNGKSLFLNAVQGILGDYARTASMDTFTASAGEKHSTDIAMLVGARLVTASETQAGKRWDEAKLKAMTGGEPITARFMRQDNFTFVPQMKLLFVGNHKPEIRDVDAAMRRRIHLVPFTVTPARVDRELGAKLREEWPAILAWMVEGCLAWQRDGLQPPTIVREATEQYFADEDAIGRWLNDCAEPDAAATVYSTELFDSWREWAGRNGEYVGTLKRLVSALEARTAPAIERWRDGATRRRGFRGLKVVHWQGTEFSA